MAKQSKQFSIGKRDIFRGLGMAVGAAVATALLDALQGPTGFNATWPEFKQILTVGLITAITYIVKNFFTKSDEQKELTNK